MPILHVLAGPNGAGKSTYANRILVPATHLPFINADEIAAIANQESFITETVFSHRSKVRLVEDALEANYSVHLHVVMIPVELSVQRVLERVRRGGHSVPEEKIRARYDRLWGLVREAVNLADAAQVLDNSRATTPFRRCASFSQGHLLGEALWPSWTPTALVSP